MSASWAELESDAEVPPETADRSWGLPDSSDEDCLSALIDNTDAHRVDVPEVDRSRSPPRRSKEPGSINGSVGHNRGDSNQERRPRRSPEVPQSIVWWLGLMVGIVNVIVEPRQPQRPMIHASIFSGLLSEISQLHHLGVHQTTLFGCDNKPEAIKFVQANCKQHCNCFFNTIEEVIAGGGVCAMHPGTYCTTPTGKIDALSIGAPCQSWAAPREKTGTTARTGEPALHPDFQATFTAVFQFLDGSEVEGGYAEQVRGFMKRATNMPGGFRTPFDLFRHKLHERGYVVDVILENNHIHWSELGRDRRSIASLFIHHTKP